MLLSGSAIRGAIRLPGWQVSTAIQACLFHPSFSISSFSGVVASDPMGVRMQGQGGKAWDGLHVSAGTASSKCAYAAWAL